MLVSKVVFKLSSKIPMAGMLYYSCSAAESKCKLKVKPLKKMLAQPWKQPKGPYIKDVRTEGGGGVGPKADIVREVAWIYSYRSSQNADKGGEGVQNPENFADVI